MDEHVRRAYERSAASERPAWICCLEDADRFVSARDATRAAASAGLSMKACVEVALVASELASNAARHGGGGRLYAAPAEGGVVVVCDDRGAGLVDVDLAVRDGYSEGRMRRPEELHRGLGAGLGTARRLSDGLAFYRREGGGLRVVAFRRRGLDRA